MNSEYEARVRYRRGPLEQAVDIAYLFGMPLDEMLDMIEKFHRIDLPNEEASMVARARGAALRPAVETLLSAVALLKREYISVETLASIMEVDNAYEATALCDAYRNLLRGDTAPLIPATIDPRTKLIVCMMVTAANFWLEYTDARFTCDFEEVEEGLVPPEGSAIEFILYAITRVHEVSAEEARACVPEMERIIGEKLLKEHRAIWDEPDEPPKLRIVK